MKQTLKVFWLLSCVTLIQGWEWFNKFDDKAEVVERSCTTEYDDIHCEKCDTDYHLSCVKSTETVCRPTSVRICNPEPMETCSFVKEDKCMQVPIPTCGVTWHKKCVDKLVCTKNFEFAVPDLPKISHPKFDKFSKFTPPPPPPPPIYPPPPPPPPMKEPVLVPAAEVNVEVVVDEVPVGPIINNGMNAGSMGSMDDPINARRRRSVDEVDEVEETEEYEDFGEIYDLEELEMLPIPSWSHESEENHGDRHKRGLPDFGFIKKKFHKFSKFTTPTTTTTTPYPTTPRTTPPPKEPVPWPAPEVNVEVMVDEVPVGPIINNGRNAGSLGSMDDPINARRRRSVDEVNEVEETEEYEDLGEIYDLEELESEENHGDRHKRGLPDFGFMKKKKPVKNCVTQKKCTNIPKKDCGIQKKETCIPFPKKKCETRMVERCHTIQRQECGEAVNEKCASIPTKVCKNVIERRPRLVCPPPPTTRRIRGPVFTKEAPPRPPITKEPVPVPAGGPVGPIINNGMNAGSMGSMDDAINARRRRSVDEV